MEVENFKKNISSEPYKHFYWTSLFTQYILRILNYV